MAGGEVMATINSRPTGICFQSQQPSRRGLLLETTLTQKTHKVTPEIAIATKSRKGKCGKYYRVSLIKIGRYGKLVT